MQDRVVILYANRYEYKNKAGVQVKGCGIKYTDGQIVREADTVGLSIQDVRGDYSLFKDYYGPGLYDVVFALNRFGNLDVKAIRWVGPCDLHFDGENSADLPSGFPLNGVNPDTGEMVGKK